VQLHAWELRTGYRRLFLRCPTCQQESAGWSWSDLAPPRLRSGAVRRRVRFGWSTNTAAKRLLG
jgi:cytochrome c-type biogenesis protein CcmH/NrfF